jgi:hypothetical protein
MSLLYRGPRTGLVRCNLAVAVIALIPPFLEFSLWLLRVGADRPLGQLAAFPEVFGAMLIGTIGANWYVALLPMVLACIFVPRLLRAVEVSSRVRTGTTLLVVSALVLMLANVALLSWQYRHGAFKFLID